MVEEKREKRGGGVIAEISEERKQEKTARGTGFENFPQFYRDSYLEGLEVALKGQEQVEKLIREASDRSFALWKEWLKQPRQWVQAWSGNAGGNLGVPNPWQNWSQECAETACGMADLFLKGTEDLFTSWFSLYEKVVAQPARKFTWQFNKQCIDGMFRE